MEVVVYNGNDKNSSVRRYLFMFAVKINVDFDASN